MSPEPEETEVETVETEVQQEPEKPRRIEIDPEELKEMRETLRRQSEELHQHKLWQMQQYQQNQRPADIQVDPDVERVIAPVVQKALRPLQDENQNLRGQLTELAETARANANIAFLERSIDNLDEIGPDIAKKIESLPKAERDFVLGSPSMILEIANGINARRGKVTKQDSRGRAFSESSTGTSPTKNSSAGGNIDWSNLSDAEFAAQEAKIENARRRR